VPSRKTGGWLRWLGRGAPEREPAEHPGRERTFTAEEALARLESRICEGVVTPQGGIGGIWDGVLNAFGRPVSVRETVGTPARVSIGAGLALSGIRSSVFLRSGGLIAAHNQLVAATERMTPLVIYRVATGQGSAPASLLSVIGAGMFQVAARNAAHAVDLALVARRVTERTLVPGLVRVHDAGPEKLRFPRDAFVREFLGAPGDQSPCPTEAQRLLFGPSRRRMVRWFDPDHPMAFGGATMPQDVARARVARELFFQSHVRELAEEAMVNLSAHVGRPLGFVEPFGVPDADVIVVAAGGAAESAQRAARRIREEQGIKAGVVALTWLRPFPEEQLAECLRGKTAVAVLETAGDPLSSQGPLTREVAAAVPELAGRLVAATCWREVPTEDGLIELFAAMSRGQLPKRIRLDSLVPPIPTGLPRIDASLQALMAAYPRLSEEALVGKAELPTTLAGGTADPEELPAIIRRIPGERQAPDSLPRFWGEIIQPALLGVHTPPEPRTATGAVPGGATALLAGPGDGPLPSHDPIACNGCGSCWSFCPDSAVAVTALGIEPLLTSASRIAGTTGASADALRRAHKHLAGRIGTVLDGEDQPGVTPEVMAGAFSWLEGKGAVPADSKTDWEAAWSATSDVVLDLAPTVTDPLFRSGSGHGELMMLAIDPRTCQSCGLCVATCDEDALHLKELAPPAREQVAHRWRLWEQLPDTSGETIARAASMESPGPLAALLMSRHTALAQAGGPDEPGSAERLALRLLTAFAERRGQTRLTQEIANLDIVAGRLQERLRSLVGDSLAEAAAGTIAEAIGKVMTERASLGELAEHLSELDVAVQVDRAAVLNTSRTAVEVAGLRERLASGADGLGRARFGVVVGQGAPASLARFPLHPWFAPAAVELADGGARLSIGLAAGLAADHVAVLRLLKRAELHLESPPEIKVKLAALQRLRWRDLTEEERADCAPLLLLTDASAWTDRALAALGPLLESSLPIKVVVLDGLDWPRGAGPALAAIAGRRAYVAACSPAYHDHLARSLNQALAFPGPALIHFQAPPPRHGIPSDGAMVMARMAVECRAHVLLRFDPRAGDGKGRLDLSGNPALDSDHGGCTLADWALAQGRFAELFAPLDQGVEGVPFADALRGAVLRGRPAVVNKGEVTLTVDPTLIEAADRRLAFWDGLRELAGIGGPLAAMIRDDVVHEQRAEHAAELEVLAAEHADELAATRKSTDAKTFDRLTDRLLAMTGYAVPPRGDG
jgi:pyruvate/2-oxoacid:ferredoxin oxidoreductase alpha subunit/ferredoxin